MELKEVLNYLGFDAEKVKTIDDLKGTFEKDFVRASAINEDSDYIKPILGKVYGTQENELKKIAKEFEIDFDADDFKEAKQVKDKLKLLTKKVADKYEVKVKEWEAKATQGNDEKVTAAEKKAEKYLKELQEKNSLLEATANEFNSFKQNASNEMKNYKLNHVKSNVFGSVKYNSQATDLAKKGFLATINEKYEFDFDEKEQPIIRLKGGTQIKNDKVAGAFLTPEDVIKNEAIQAGLYEVNSQANNQRQTVQIGASGSQQQQQVVNPNGQAKRVVAPRL